MRRDCPIFLFSVDPFFFPVVVFPSFCLSLLPLFILPSLLLSVLLVDSIHSSPSPALISSPPTPSSPPTHNCNHNSEETHRLTMSTDAKTRKPASTSSLSHFSWHPFCLLLTPFSSSSFLSFTPSTSPLLTSLTTIHNPLSGVQVSL